MTAVTFPSGGHGRRLSAIILAIVAVVAACGPKPSGPAQAIRRPVTLTWWHYPADGPVAELWQQVAAEFERQHPHVTVVIEADANVDRPIASVAGGGPDLFEAAGGGWDLADRVRAGTVMDITDLVGPELDRIGGSAAGWRVEGRQYGLPYSTGVEGFWYRVSAFAQAGVTAPPKTLAELTDAVARLRAAGIIPIVVNAAAGWPVAHWWHNFALRRCPADVLARSAAYGAFTDPCFVRAGEDVAAFADIDAFQPLTECVTCLSGENPSWRLARGEAAMELMGHWHGEVLAAYAGDLGQDPDALRADLGWFPFPSLPDGRGEPGAVLGAGSGFACSADAPPECVTLLRYIVSRPVQTLYAAGHVQPWLDVAFGPTVGIVLNAAAVELFRGQVTPEAVVAAMNDAARPTR